MPPLPRKNKRTEAKVDDKVADFLWKHHPRSFGLEVKVKGGRFLDHQKKALKQIANDTFRPFKIPDQGRRNPLDYLCIKHGDSIACVVDGKNVTCVVNDTYEIAFMI